MKIPLKFILIFKNTILKKIIKNETNYGFTRDYIKRF